jgi:hypothetical protein
MNNSFGILDALRKYEYLGTQKLNDGTELIGRAPHIAPMAWLHTIYMPLSNEEIMELESRVQQRIPSSYKNFLLISNGLNVFNTTLSLYGLRRNYKRTVDDVWQPFDIILPNTVEKPSNADNNNFIIGSYDWDGSYIYIDKTSNKVFLCERENATPLFEWENFELMLDSEIIRISKLFDNEGKEINIDESTLPIG